MEETIVSQATYEAIFWWNHGEGQYHRYFKNLDKIAQNGALLAFFTSRVFEPFLREYSVRRNIAASTEGVDSFLGKLMKTSFFSNVQEGKISTIDTTSAYMQQEGSTLRQTKSLLSKIAFLINPNQFTLYDSFAKSSLRSYAKEIGKGITISDTNSYSLFFDGITDMRKHIQSKNYYNISDTVLEKFTDTEAYPFFRNNPDAFRLRIIDKMLWLKGQSDRGKKSKIRKVNNFEYVNLLKIAY